MGSKTISELQKLSANHTAFDLPVHEGGQVTTTREPARTRDLPNENRSSTPSHSRDNVRRVSAASCEAETPKSALGTLLRTLDAARQPGATGARERPQSQPLGGATKRALDIAIAGTAVVLLSPLILMVALLIVITMGRPVLFPQRRLGFAGRPFDCYKFRTMVNDADAALRAHLADSPEAAREWRTRQKLQHDPRVTLLGRLLRRSSIDELPQLFNVLRGDMSCIGPRPVVNDEIARYGKYWNDYTKARPGLTGAWQVSGRNRLSYPRRVAIDSRYVRKWSLARDLWILVKTIPAVLRSDTA